MSEFDYSLFYDRVGFSNRWNFSRIKCEMEGVGLNLFTEVIKRTEGSEILLDVGTGGGEAVLSISNSVLLLVGIDNNAARFMIVANK